jgi:hypothetical protein
MGFWTLSRESLTFMSLGAATLVAVVTALRLLTGFEIQRALAWVARQLISEPLDERSAERVRRIMREDFEELMLALIMPSLRQLINEQTRLSAEFTRTIGSRFDVVDERLDELSERLGGVEERLVAVEAQQLVETDLLLDARDHPHDGTSA